MPLRRQGTNNHKTADFYMTTKQEEAQYGTEKLKQSKEQQRFKNILTSAYMVHEYDTHTSMDRYAHLSLKMFYLNLVDSPPGTQLLENVMF